MVKQLRLQEAIYGELKWEEVPVMAGKTETKLLINGLHFRNISEECG